MAIELVPLPLPASADPSKFADFGREVKGINPGTLSPEEFEQVKDALYKVSISPFPYLHDPSIQYRQHDALLFRDVVLTPEQQYALTKVIQLPTMHMLSFQV
jgi:hypothetical protein